MTSQDVIAIRERFDESRKAFARRLGVNVSTLFRWEKHGVPVKGTARAALAQLKAALDRGTPAQQRGAVVQ